MTTALRVAALCLVAGPAWAEPLTSVSPLRLQAILDADLTLNDEAGDATLSGMVAGAPFDIYFYDCDGGGFLAPARPDSACLGVEYRAYFEGYPADAELVNAWNDANHYGTLWRDADEDLALQLNVVVEGGVTEENLRATYVWWGRVVESFEAFMGDR